MRSWLVDIAQWFLRVRWFRLERYEGHRNVCRLGGQERVCPTRSPRVTDSHFPGHDSIRIVANQVDHVLVTWVILCCVELDGIDELPRFDVNKLVCASSRFILISSFGHQFFLS